METKHFIAQSLEQVHIRLMATCEGLTQEQVLWRPMPYANSIGFILWHVARADDERVSNMQGGRDLWVSEGWYEKFGQPIDSPDPGDRMGFQALYIPELEVLTDYLKAIHNRIQSFLSPLEADDLDKPLNPSEPNQTLAGVFRHMITHKNNHHGQVDYIRGLQDESWDLPRGTGTVLPPPS